MAANQISGFIQHLRTVLRDGVGLTDGQLLADYLSRRDEAAIAALVRRHGPMVWGVCRRVLRNHHDAEDAFQTTFLVLVRKAASIASRELLANWLYGVAHQTALKARATAAKRKGREKQVTEMPEPAVTQQDPWHDLQPLLDEELSRLPAKYRSVIVLCDLEGKTRKEAAAQLRCPEGTVAGRLARARTMLANRLTRQGVVLSGGALAAVLAQQASAAAVPASVVVTTIKAASLLAAGKAAAAGAISVKVAALTEGVMKAMLFTKLKVAMAILLAVAIAGVGAVGLLHQTQASEPAKAQARSDKDEKQAAPAPKEDKDKLQGTWRPVSVEIDGVTLGEGREEIKDDRLVIEKSSLTLSYTERSPLTKPEAKKAVADFSLDAKQTPKVIVLRWKKSPYNGEENVTQKAIYAVEGDTLKLCLGRGEDEKNPPTDFSAKAGSSRVLSVFKRDPASDKKDEAVTDGKVVGGLRIQLQLHGPKMDNKLPSHCVVVLENVGDSDLNVQLGYSLANGKSYYPAALRLLVSLKGNKSQTLTYSEVRVTGRLDPFVVPLPAGSSYTLRCPLDKFVDSKTGEGLDLTAKEYRIAAELVGQPVTKASPDLQGLTLMPYWQGTARSNEVKALPR